MKHGRITSVVLAILVVTALSAAGASAQSVPQQAQSGDVAMPTDVAGSSPINISSNFETGNEQVSESQTVGPQAKKERRQRSERVTKDAAIPTEAAPTKAAPSSANPTYPGGSGGAPAPAPPPQPEAKAELPKTGGSSVASLFALGAGALLIGGGLLVRRISR